MLLAAAVGQFQRFVCCGLPDGEFGLGVNAETTVRRINVLFSSRGGFIRLFSILRVCGGLLPRKKFQQHID
jgi:hypothetical protein